MKTAYFVLYAGPPVVLFATGIALILLLRYRVRVRAYKMLPEELNQTPNYDKRPRHIGHPRFILRFTIYNEFCVIASPIPHIYRYEDIREVVVQSYVFTNTELDLFHGTSGVPEIFVMPGRLSGEENTTLVKELNKRVHVRRLEKR